MYQVELEKKKNILLCPLEWGLGHAGRMIPVAKRLLEKDHNVFIASGNEHISFFKSEIEGLSYINFPGFKPYYSRILPQYLILLFQIPAIIFHSVREHYRLKKIIKEYNIDIVISDNRFGLWNRKVKTVYVTHMPLIPFPEPFTIFEFIGVRLHRMIIKRYDFCFIPDLPGEVNISGRLSHGVKLPSNTRFIGILSRFSNQGKIIDNAENNITVILSGPEPQRSMLKKTLSEILKKDCKNVSMLGGRPGELISEEGSGNIRYYNHITTAGMAQMLLESNRIISRSGYSTIMELISLGCNSLLIPTPGQTEQEYLARILTEKGWFTTIGQSQLSESSLHYPGKAEFPAAFDSSIELFNKAFRDLLNYHHKQEKP